MKFEKKKILVGVTGGIAAYKTCSLVNLLISRGAEVRVIMTDNAKQFVSPLTFQTLTNHSVYSQLWDQIDQNTVEHISMSHWPDLIIISPATANTIGKMANGLADNLLTTVVLATLPETKVLVVPAMNNNMWNSSILQKNIKTLQETKRFIFMDPRAGVLACRDEGIGKIAENADIVQKAESLL